MIEYGFRGKRLDNDEWVYGDFIKGEYCYISSKENFYNAVVSIGGNMATFVDIIDPKTIGHYINLKDKNKNKIYMGDIIKNCDDNCIYIYALRTFEDLLSFYYWYRECVICEDNIEILGNIYENPELSIGG